MSKNVTARFPKSLDLKKEWYYRLKKLNDLGWTTVDVMELGIQTAEENGELLNTIEKTSHGTGKTK